MHVHIDKNKGMYLSVYISIYNIFYICIYKPIYLQFNIATGIFWNTFSILFAQIKSQKEDYFLPV